MPGSGRPGDVNETRRTTPLDDALRAWPSVAPTPQEQEQFAERVDRRITTGERGTTRTSIDDSKLFGRPLPELPEEGHNSAASGGRSGVAREGAFSAQEGAQSDAERPVGGHVPGRTLLSSSGKSNTPPEPPQHAEGIKMSSQSSERERDRRSLKDLARLASSPTLASNVSSQSNGSVSGIRNSESDQAGSATKEDSGLIDLKAMSQPDLAGERVSNVSARGAGAQAPLASSGLFDDEITAAKGSIPAPPSSRGFDTFARSSVPSVLPAEVHAAPSMPMPSASPVQAVAAGPAAGSLAKSETSEKKGGAVYFLGGLGGLAAVAAAAFFVVRAMQPKAEPIVVTPAAIVQPAAIAANATGAAAPVQAGQAPAATAVAQAANAPTADPGVDPMSLPQAGAKGAAPAKAGAVASHAAAATPATTTKGAKGDVKVATAEES